MRTRKLMLAFGALLTVVGSLEASVLYNHVTYWVEDGTILWDPAPGELDPYLGGLDVMVQQAVYDETQSAQILDEAGLSGYGTYLYAYSVTNLGLASNVTKFSVTFPSGDCGLVSVHANPNIPDPLRWDASQEGDNPVWSHSSLGIRMGSTMGGFWATSDCQHASASMANASTINDGNILGEAIAPLPEPMTLTFLALGALAVAFRSRRAVLAVSVAAAIGGFCVVTRADQILDQGIVEWPGGGAPTEIMVQHTVYDEERSRSILTSAGISPLPVESFYLYAYHLHNETLSEAITKFQVEWPQATLLEVYVDDYAAGALGFVPVDDGSGNPKWTSSGPGVTTGMDIGGFWALANQTPDPFVGQFVPAGVVAGSEITHGQGTKGPLPEPSTLLLFGLAGVIGLGGGRA